MKSCPYCGKQLRDSFSWLVFFAGGLIAVLFRNAGRRKRVRCNRCEATFYIRSRLSNISLVIFWIAEVLNPVAELFENKIPQTGIRPAIFYHNHVDRHGLRQRALNGFQDKIAAVVDGDGYRDVLGRNIIQRFSGSGNELTNFSFS